MKNVRINDNSYTEVTRNADPGERWDGDDTYTSHSFDSFRVVGKNDYYDLSVPNVADIMYLLVVHYNTRNSFSRDDGKVEYVGLYADENIAYDNEKRINALLQARADYDKQQYGWPQKKGKKLADPGYIVKLIEDTGLVHNYQASTFIGYFEIVNDVEVIALIKDED